MSDTIKPIPPRPEELVERTRQYVLEIQPFISLIADIRNIARFTIIMRGDGVHETQYHYTPEQEHIIKFCEVEIEHIKRRYQFPPEYL